MMFRTLFLTLAFGLVAANGDAVLSPSAKDPSTSATTTKSKGPLVQGPHVHVERAVAGVKQVPGTTEAAKMLVKAVRDHRAKDLSTSTATSTESKGIRGRKEKGVAGASTTDGDHHGRSLQPSLASCYDSDNGYTDSGNDDCSAYNGNSGWCGNYDVLDPAYSGVYSFASNDMCCACGGGYATCMDLDYDYDLNVNLLDKDGDGCGYYTINPNFCGHFDDWNFVSSVLCCACGGGFDPSSFGDDFSFDGDDWWQTSFDDDIWGLFGDDNSYSSSGDDNSYSSSYSNDDGFGDDGFDLGEFIDESPGIVAIVVVLIVVGIIVVCCCCKKTPGAGEGAVEMPATTVAVPAPGKSIAAPPQVDAPSGELGAWVGGLGVGESGAAKLLKMLTGDDFGATRVKDLLDLEPGDLDTLKATLPKLKQKAFLDAIAALKNQV